MAMPTPEPVTNSIPIPYFILKVASRCNLDCSYCYVYNKGDRSWRSKPPLMSDTTFDATLKRVREHCLLVGQKSVNFVFHGGEPMLLGPTRFAKWCERAQKVLDDVADVSFLIQTNGTLIDNDWAAVLSRYCVRVGVSVDGPPQVHDAFRVDHYGRGSYRAVARGIDTLHAANMSFGINCTLPFGADPIKVHRHFVALGANAISYAFPDFTHDTIAPLRRNFGPTPCADFLIPIFNDWWVNSTLKLQIREFWAMSRAILGGTSRLDYIGSGKYGYIFVESDGTIEGLDHLRICDESLYRTDKNVNNASFVDVLQPEFVHTQLLTGSVPIPRDCATCQERDTCAGGYLPHRYSHARRFENPSVWCEDLLALFAHLRAKLEVTPEETRTLRKAYRDPQINRALASTKSKCALATGGKCDIATCSNCDLAATCNKFDLAACSLNTSTISSSTGREGLL